MTPVLHSNTVILRIERLQKERHLFERKRRERDKNLAWAWNVLHTMCPNMRNITDITVFRSKLNAREIPNMGLCAVLGSVPYVCAETKKFLKKY